MDRTPHRRALGTGAVALAVVVALVSPLSAAPPRPEPRIVGGTEVSPPGTYPFAAALLNGSFFICGGSLVAPTWVVTAAHCVTDGDGVQNVFPATLDVAIGRHDLTTGSGIQHDVASIVVHPDWAGDVFPGTCGPGQGVLCFDHDIALIELATPSVATPVVLATGNDDFLWDEGDVATVMGWGVITDNDPPVPDEYTNVLHEVDVPLRSAAECVGDWGNSPFFYPAEDLCAGGAGVDSCTGDSGGPLVAPPGESGWQQVGIVSFGGNKCGAPAPVPVYTRVAAYTAWITSIVGDIDPQGFPGEAVVHANTPTPITLTGGDSNGDGLGFSLDIAPLHGSLGAFAGSGEIGSVVYTPDPGYLGPDSFSFRVSDGAGTPGIGTITLLVANAAPTALPLTASTSRDEALPLTLSASDPDGDTLTFTIVDGADHGTLAGLTQAPPAAATVTYVPNPGFVGTDSFTFEVSDGNGATAGAIVTIAVTLPTATVGLVDTGQGRWYLYDSAGTLQRAFFFGNPDDLPIAGDWNGDGVATPGLYRQSDGFFYTRDSNTEGPADFSCFAGNPEDVPIVGDWDGDGDDNLGIYRPSEQRFYLFTITCTGSPMGAAQISMEFGNPGDTPVAGDWDGDGIAEVGLHRDSTGLFYWRVTLDTGVASGAIIFGDPGDRFVAGDFGTADGNDTPGLFRPGDLTFYFRHSLTPGFADDQFAAPGVGGGWLPVAGAFGFD